MARMVSKARDIAIRRSKTGAPPLKNAPMTVPYHSSLVRFHLEEPCIPLITTSLILFRRDLSSSRIRQHHFGDDFCTQSGRKYQKQYRNRLLSTGLTANSYTEKGRKIQIPYNSRQPHSSSDHRHSQRMSYTSSRLSCRGLHLMILLVSATFRSI